jgi:RimJ/RimL family protein N-acetyltransferase
LVPASELLTPRLRLRGFTDADLEPFAAMNADPRVMEHFPSPLTREQSDGLVDRIAARWESDGFGLWAVERLEDGVFLGFTGLTPPGFDANFTPCVEIGWRFAVDAWGHGYATEAARAALRFGFEELELDEILSWTIPDNWPSRRVMERIGMTHDPADDFDHPRHLANDRIRRHVLYRLSRQRWASLGDPG